ncbi:hypothetical protein [Nocardiopsis nanhaiensis]
MPQQQPGPTVPLADVIALVNAMNAALELPEHADLYNVRRRVSQVQGCLDFAGSADDAHALASATNVLRRVVDHGGA